ncbi:MAG: GDCCVxC domain-containing (seleno)protein [Candidatus Thiodiazotropha sp.]
MKVQTIPASTITCPECGFSRKESMPTDRCIWYWQCPDCGVMLKPKQGDCCVYCSYGDTPCPPVQIHGKSHCCR